MTTPTGTIGMSDVNIEIGRAYYTPINLNEAPVRSLAGVSSGAISMNNLRGKSATVPFSGISWNTAYLSNHQFSFNSYESSAVSGVTVTPNGGTAPYTYTWTRTSGESGMSCTGGASPTFSYTGYTPWAVSATWKVRVTDASGAWHELSGLQVDLSAGSEI